MMQCTTCKAENPQFKLWQTSKNKYEKFCGLNCLEVYLDKKYKKSLAKEHFKFAKEFLEKIN